SSISILRCFTTSMPSTPSTSTLFPYTNALPIFDAETSVALSRRINDALYETVRGTPTRFAGFAVLPTSDPKAAADELDRTVTKRSEEHTSELQSHLNLVCRLLLEKKKRKQ